LGRLLESDWVYKRLKNDKIIEKMKQLVCGMLIDEDTFLIGRRKPDNKNYPDMWELPGGKVEDGESSWEAINREWMEELNIRVKVLHQIPEREMMGTEKTMVFPYILRYESGKPQKNDHSDIKFIKFDEIKDYNFTPISKEVIHIIKRSYALFFKQPQ
jgi:8-oxo-dGTP diphosphatase